MQSTLFAFIGALNLDSNLSNKTYKSLVTLLPFLFLDLDSKDLSLFKQECLAIIEEKTEIVRFPEIFRVSKEGFKVKTFSMNDYFYYPGKLFNIHEIDIYDKEESYEKLKAYITELEEKNKYKIVNIIFNDANLDNPNSYIEKSNYIVHSHVLSVCLRKEREMGRSDLIKDFLTRMRNSAKQRVINEQKTLKMT